MQLTAAIKRQIVASHKTFVLFQSTSISPRDLCLDKLKQLFILVALAFVSVQSYAQCPEGDVLFNNQTQIDQFVIDYPDCTQIEGDLTINYFTGEPIIDLTPLAGLTSVTGALRLQRLFYYDSVLDEDVITSLEGLENITSVGHLYIGSPEIPGSFPSVFDDLSPLNNISGDIGFFWITKTAVLSPLPDFPLVETIDYFRMAGVSWVTTTPTFPGLTHVRDFTVQQVTFAPVDMLTTVIIPTSLSTVSAELNPDIETAGMYFFRLPMLEEIIGGESLTAIDGEFFMTEVPVLDNMVGFDLVTQVQSISMGLCQTSPFNSFPLLEQADYISLGLGNDCDDFSETATTVTFGSNATAISVVGEAGLEINFSPFSLVEVEEIVFTGNYTTLGKLKVTAFNVTSISGFENLELITGDLELRTPMLTALPAFNNLNTIGGQLWLIPLLGIPFALTDLSGLESLTSLGALRIYPPGSAEHNLQSLDGLSSLTEITGSIRLRNLPNLTNIEAIGDAVEFSDELILQNLPLLDNCGLSPVVCHLVSSAETVTLSGNGDDCNDFEQVLLSCSSSVGDEDANEGPSVTLFFDGQSRLNIESTREGRYEVLLCDQMGRVIFYEQLLLNAGRQSFALPTNLASGIYLARWVNGQHSDSVKLMHSAF